VRRGPVPAAGLLAGGVETFRGVRNGVYRLYCTRGRHYYDPSIDKDPITTLGDLFTAKTRW
jgi:hypothetical protein